MWGCSDGVCVHTHLINLIRTYTYDTFWWPAKIWDVWNSERLEVAVGHTSSEYVLIVLPYVWRDVNKHKNLSELEMEV